MAKKYIQTLENQFCRPFLRTVFWKNPDFPAKVWLDVWFQDWTWMGRWFLSNCAYHFSEFKKLLEKGGALILLCARFNLQSTHHHCLSLELCATLLKPAGHFKNLAGRAELLHGAYVQLLAHLPSSSISYYASKSRADFYSFVSMRAAPDFHQLSY